ncbi:hypothetical protein [Ammoniphilus sp. YIM 78166]|uniref:hypothetical protein n=1 Tax=Ammoniphilus sp. YIM 78166 TaxID=1644106 RepID=UPI00106FFBBF|nr:hypothetical protein [Ammoniphilus sp. YIM 78166]
MKSMSKTQLMAHTRCLEDEMVKLQSEINWNWDTIRKAQTAEDNIANLEQKLFQIKSEHRKCMLQLVSGIQG